MPKFTAEEQMAVLATTRAKNVLTEIQASGFIAAQLSLDGCSEQELYDIFDTLLNGTQVVLAARRALRDKS